MLILNRAATILSTALLIMVVLMVARFVISPREGYFSISDTLHVGCWGQGCDIRIVCFNDLEYGPYRGSLIGLSDADGNLQPPLETQTAFGDAWGIYYRDFQWPDSRLWTCMLSVWYPIVAFAIMPAMCLRRILSQSRLVQRET